MFKNLYIQGGVAANTELALGLTDTSLLSRDSWARGSFLRAADAE